MEIFTFLHYANEESDDVIGGSTKTVQHSITNISRNIKAVFFLHFKYADQCSTKCSTLNSGLGYARETSNHHKDGHGC